MALLVEAGMNHRPLMDTDDSIVAQADLAVAKEAIRRQRERDEVRDHNLATMISNNIAQAFKG